MHEPSNEKSFDIHNHVCMYILIVICLVSRKKAIFPIYPLKSFNCISSVSLPSAPVVSIFRAAFARQSDSNDDIKCMTDKVLFSHKRCRRGNCLKSENVFIIQCT